MTDSRALRTTMGPGCLTAVFGMGTGVAIRVWSPGSHIRSQGVRNQESAGRQWSVSTDSSLLIPDSSYIRVAARVGFSLIALVWEGRIKAAKRLAVSTGRLRSLLALHLRPIDLVVFQEPMGLAARETWSCGEFHA